MSLLTRLFPMFWVLLATVLSFCSVVQGEYYSQLQRCPQRCSVVGSSPSNWTTYHNHQRLRMCNETFLFETNLYNPISDGDTHTTLRACMSDPTFSIKSRQDSSSTCNYTTEQTVTTRTILFETPSLVNASTLSVSLAAMLDSLLPAFEDQYICGEAWTLFAQDNDLVVGIFVGAAMDGFAAAKALVQQITIQAQAEISGDSAVEICSPSSTSTAGIFLSTTGDYNTTQNALRLWSDGTCVRADKAAGTASVTLPFQSQAITQPAVKRDTSLEARGTCSYILVQSGDSCGSLASRCGISGNTFTSYNPSPTLCSTLMPAQPVCCSSGTLPNLTPQQNSDGSCHSYNVQPGDYCYLLASNNYITTDQIESFNTQTWGWMGCNDLQAGATICLSTGTPPMPAAVSNAVCGPQVPGTARPSSWLQISSLNPCPLNACCDMWGQCGTTPEFCTASSASTGAPGTAAPGQNGCISNCGTSIVNNAKPASFINIGYFEAFGVDRSCLAMDASQVPNTYTHIHFAFAQISSNFQVDLSGSMQQFMTFVNMRGYKKILSFGGWSFSTDLDSYAIFRNVVTDANRLTFAQSVVATINQYGLDGVDFDWEYPGAPDIPGIPAGSSSDGPNYLEFLQTLRGLMPAGKSLSIAAPASYWYLKGFPIAAIANVVDYIVYMTYDLHGQWDYGNQWSQEGCPTGNCLRSHVNLTETHFALSMITKAGVPTNKIVVGVASYGRSFGMVDPSCTGPACLFTGPDSTATPGECTQTAGYISLAELQQGGGLSKRDGGTSWHDASSDSDMMTYGDGSWVSYMTSTTKASRISLYTAWGFLGSVEWAVDLAAFVADLETVIADLDLAITEAGLATAIAQENYDTSQFRTFNLSDLATRLVGYDECDPAQKSQIWSGWVQSWKIMNLMYDLTTDGISIKKLDYNQASAVEFLGPPALNQPQQGQYEEIYQQLSTIQPGFGSIPLPWQWRLHVRCDDPSGLCLCGLESQTTAYTTQNDPKYGLARINFCPKYFNMQSLDTAISNFAHTNLDPFMYANMDSYDPNQGSVWYHELMHIDWASGVSGSSHIRDVKLWYRLRDGTTGFYEAYGATACKALARWGLSTGAWTIRNADSLGLFALAQYVQKALGGIYPHLPLAVDPPKVGPGSANDPYVEADRLFTIMGDGSAEPPSDTSLASLITPGSGNCANGDDQDGDSDPSATLSISASFAQATDFPPSYLSSYSSWLSQPTQAASPPSSPPPSWSIAIYSQPNCQGDYYSLTGTNPDTIPGVANVCTPLQGTTPQFGDGIETTCNWFTNGGESSAPCSTSTLMQPQSWSVSNGVCTAYDTIGCVADGNDNAYTSGQGCHNWSKADFDTTTWASVKCGAT